MVVNHYQPRREMGQEWKRGVHSLRTLSKCQCHWDANWGNPNYAELVAVCGVPLLAENCSWGVLLGFANSGWDMDGRGKRREEIHHPWHSFHFHVVFKITFHGYFHAKVAPTHLFSSSLPCRLPWLCLVGQRSRHRHSCTLHAAIAVRTARPDSKTFGLRWLSDASAFCLGCCVKGPSWFSFFMSISDPFGSFWAFVLDHFRCFFVPKGASHLQSESVAAEELRSLMEEAQVQATTGALGRGRVVLVGDILEYDPIDVLCTHTHTYIYIYIYTH